MSGTLTELIIQLTKLVQSTVPVLIALALLFFLWGVATFILNVDDETKRKEGKLRMLWGMVALFFIVSIGGLIVMIQVTFFGSGLHSTTNFGPNFFGFPSNSLNSDVPAGSFNPSFNFNNDFEGGHTAPGGAEGNSLSPTSKIDNSFRLVGDSDGSGQSSPIKTRLCLLGIGFNCNSR